MTQEQIKAIAEEYRKEYNYHKDVANDATELLTWLCKRYCIVEREKVIGAYRDNLQKENEAHRQGFDDYVYTYRNEQLTDLFGTSMFNQNEE